MVETGILAQDSPQNPFGRKSIGRTDVKDLAQNLLGRQCPSGEFHIAGNLISHVAPTPQYNMLMQILRLELLSGAHG